MVLADSSVSGQSTGRLHFSYPAVRRSPERPDSGRSHNGSSRHWIGFGGDGNLSGESSSAGCYREFGLNQFTAGNGRTLSLLAQQESSVDPTHSRRQSLAYQDSDPVCPATAASREHAPKKNYPGATRTCGRGEDRNLDKRRRHKDPPIKRTAIARIIITATSMRVSSSGLALSLNDPIASALVTGVLIHSHSARSFSSNRSIAGPAPSSPSPSTKRDTVSPR